MSFHDAFDASLDFNPAGDLAAFYHAAPARWVVYLMADADDRPIQLLCVKNLRSSLKRRLGDEVPTDGPPQGLTRKIDYKQIVRRVYWRGVDSPFEADWRYFEAARLIFPNSYRGMIGFRPAWFIHINPEAQFPRFTKTIDLSVKAGLLLGPIEDKHAAARLIETAVDAFDLCRYYSILVQAPHGRACAYKEMGKCPAPCDGSISVPQYRRLVTMSVSAMVDPQPLVCEHTQRMQSAAAEMNFESAQKIKAFITQLGKFRAGPFRHVRPLAEFKYLSVQKGSKAGTAKLFLITPGEVEPIACLTIEPRGVSDLLRSIFANAEGEKTNVDALGADRIGVVSHHLFAPAKAPGVILPLAEVNDRSLLAAYKQLMKQAGKDDESAEEEGLLKEMQSL